MARIEEVERRLLNWARWRIGGQRGGLGFAAVSWGMTTGGQRNREAIIPTDAAEASETDWAVRALEHELQAVVVAHYAEGLSVAALSVRSSCSTAAVYSRIDRVHRLLDQAFRDMAIARRTERARIEGLTAAARPEQEF